MNTTTWLEVSIWTADGRTYGQVIRKTIVSGGAQKDEFQALVLLATITENAAQAAQIIGDYISASKGMLS